MKGWIFLIILIAAAWYLVSNGIPGGEAGKILAALKENGVENAFVSVSDGSATVRFEAPGVNENLLDYTYSVARTALAASDANAVRAEAYVEWNPVVAVTVTRENEENPSVEDIRPVEKRIESVVGLFDAIPLDVNVDEDAARVRVQYYGSQDKFWHDFFGMAFGIIDAAPWVERIVVKYVGEENTTIAVDTNTVLSVYAGKIDAKEAAERIQIQ